MMMMMMRRRRRKRRMGADGDITKVPNQQLWANQVFTNFYKLPSELPNLCFKELLDFFISFSSFQSLAFFSVSNAEQVLDVSRRSIIWGGVRTKDNLLQYRCCSRSSLFTLLPKSAKHNVSTILGWKTAASKKLSNCHRRRSRSPPECRRRWREMTGWFVQSFATGDNLTMPFGAGSNLVHYAKNGPRVIFLHNWFKGCQK